MPRYLKDLTGILNSDLYFNIFEKKGRKFLKIRRTVSFKNLQETEVDVLTEHIWAKEDKLFKLSMRYYGTIDFWWVIGLVNKKPTDGHFKIGEIVYIPNKPSTIVGALR